MLNKILWSYDLHKKSRVLDRNVQFCAAARRQSKARQNGMHITHIESVHDVHKLDLLRQTRAQHRRPPNRPPAATAAAITTTPAATSTTTPSSSCLHALLAVPTGATQASESNNFLDDLPLLLYFSLLKNSLHAAKRDRVRCCAEGPASPRRQHLQRQHQQLHRV